MKFRSLRFLALLALTATTAQGAEPTEVVLSTGPCAYGFDSGWLSSARLFKVGSRALAIASSERAFDPSWPGAERYCHRVRIGVGAQELGLEPVAVDLGVGLALLELKTPGEALLAQLEALPPQPDPKPKMGAVVFLGTLAGEILSTRSDRHMLPALARTWEWKTDLPPPSPVGRWVRQEQATWLAMASHQYLEMRPGRKTRLDAWAPTAAPKGSGHLVLIPGEVILSWVRSALAGQLGIRFSKDPDQEWLQEPRWMAAGLAFEADCPPAKEGQEPPMTGDYPIGGGDGVGIGGSTTQDRQCLLKVRKAEQGAREAAFPLPAREDWLNAVRSQLKTQDEVTVWYWAHAGVPSAFGSLSEFFTDFGDSKNQPIWFAGPPVSELQVLGAEVSRLAIETWRGTFIKIHTAEDVIRRWFFFGKVAASQDPLAVPASELVEWLPQNNVRGWEAFWAFHPGGKNPTADQFEAAVRRLHEALKKQEGLL